MQWRELPSVSLRLQLVNSGVGGTAPARCSASASTNSLAAYTCCLLLQAAPVCSIWREGSVHAKPTHATKWGWKEKKSPLAVRLQEKWNNGTSGRAQLEEGSASYSGVGTNPHVTEWRCINVVRIFRAWRRRRRPLPAPKFAGVLHSSSHETGAKNSTYSTALSRKERRHTYIAYCRSAG